MARGAFVDDCRCIESANSWSVPGWTSTPAQQAPGSTSLALRKDSEATRLESRYCPEPDSNRHGLAAEGFSYSLQLSLLSLPLIWSLDFLFAIVQRFTALVIRQGPSSLYTFPMDLPMRQPKYSVEQLREAVQTSTSMRQVLTKLSVAPYGGNYDVLRGKLKRLGLDTSHFLGRAWNRNRCVAPKTPLQQYLDEQRPIQSYKLKNRLLKHGVLAPVCVGCDLHTWLDQPIPLELDHINGDNKDNRLENLRLLCPNCHALTPTYRSKRRSRGLSSGLQAPPGGGAGSPNLTPFTPAVSEPGAQFS
jgi:hypothetical protein